MAAHDALRGFLAIGFFLLMTGACTALLLPPESGEFVVSVCGSMIGMVLIIGAVVMWRLVK